MRKLLLTLAALALLAPVTAPGKPPPPTKKIKQVAAGNAAWSCRTERQVLGAAAFAKKYGTQAKCVSKRKEQLRSGARLFEKTSGALTSSGSANTLTLAVTGSVEGRPIADGPSTATLKVDLSRSSRNGLGGYCAAATGSATLADTATSTISLSLAGTYCTLGSAENAAQGFVGTYTVSDGSGTYAESAGTGIAVLFVAAGSADARLLALGGFSLY